MAAGVLAVAALAAGAAAQAPGADGSVSEALELTAQAPSGVEAESSLAGCPSVEVYGIAEPGNGPAETARAYTSPSTAGPGCPTLFRAPSPGAFNVTLDATARLFVGCDEPAVLHQPLNNVRVWLLRNGREISEGRNSLPLACTPGEPMEIEVSIQRPDEPGFGPDDVLGVNVTVFGSPNYAVDNLHLLVGGNETASTVTIPGVAEALEPDEEAEPVEVTAEQNATTPANSSTTPASPSTNNENGTPMPGAVFATGVLALGALATRRRRDR